MNWRTLLLPLSWLYGVVVWVRNSMFDSGLLKSTAFNLPVISVGNITVGGTGKTPHIEYLVELLKDQYRVATLSRGYKRKTRDFRLATISSTATEIGDEPLQIKKEYPDITVAVDRKRVHGVRNLMEKDPSIDLVLLDDAYQHRFIQPGFSILLIDYAHPVDQDFLLPAGMLREPARNRNRADMILVTRTPEHLKPIELRQYVNALGLTIRQHLFFTTMRYGKISPLFPIDPSRDMTWFKEQQAAILLVTGIADPAPIKQFAQSNSQVVQTIQFPDHHFYSGKDMERIAGAYKELKRNNREVLILTTRKDAVKLQRCSPDNSLKRAIYSIQIHVQFLNNDKPNFDQQIRNYASSNKRNSILHQR